MILQPDYKQHLKHYSNQFLVGSLNRVRTGRCLMSAKRKDFFIYSASKRHCNIYIKDKKFLQNYIDIVQKMTNTTISFYLTKNRIIFNIVSNNGYTNYNVYRAVVLTRFITLKQFFLYPIAIVELSKYLNLNETLYITNYMYPTNCYWGLYNLFDRIHSYYCLGFKDHYLITSFTIDFKDEKNYSFNDYFYTNGYINTYKTVDADVKYKLHYLLLHGLFKEAADYYNILKN